MQWGQSWGNIWGVPKPKTTSRIVYDYRGLVQIQKRIVYDYNALFAKRTTIVYDYTGKSINTDRIVYDYLKFVPDNVRIIFNPYAQDSVRLDWSGFVAPVGYVGDFFYAVYIEGELYEGDIDSNQTWMDIDGLVNLEDILIDVVIQTFFGQRFNFDFSSVGDRIKILFTESSDPNISRYIFFGDNGTGSVDFTKEIGEIIIAESETNINTGFVPEGS